MVSAIAGASQKLVSGYKAVISRDLHAASGRHGAGRSEMRLSPFRGTTSTFSFVMRDGNS